MKSRFWSSDWLAGLLITIVEDAADVRTIRADIPEALAAIINKALLKDVELRYQSGAEFADALKVLLKA